MAGAIVVTDYGPPEVLRWAQTEVREPGPGELLVRHTAVGLNFIDVYHRTGLYPLALPFTPGVEGAGVVIAIGEGVSGFAEGDRVAYTGNGPVGSYAEERVLPSARLVRLPAYVDDLTAAAVMLKGCTVEYLVRRAFAVQPGHRVLLHAAAGGVGLIACQWLQALGATVIGTVGSEEKAELAKAHGCRHAILYRDEDVAARVAEVTDGRGVHVAYDGVGAATFHATLESLASRGVFVSFGNASGPPPPIAPGQLAQRGSLFLTRPRLAHYYATPEDAAEGFAALFQIIESRQVTPHIGAQFPLREAAAAHRELEARSTVGSTVLIV